MPKIAEYRGFQFFIFSSDLNERIHVHVLKSQEYGRVGKFWIEPEIELFETGNLTKKDIALLQKILKKNLEKVKTQINTFRRTGKVKMITLR
ncbi:MAG: DUF4160 domain-containing protein [Leptospiraceae bacterium]|nr:DUF4160 domain-containing protein [Leptospiraceae bacterium]